MVEFLKDNSDADFVSPYDHLDYYTENIHRYKSTIKISKSKHWRTAWLYLFNISYHKKNFRKNTKNILDI